MPDETPLPSEQDREFIRLLYRNKGYVNALLHSHQVFGDTGLQSPEILLRDFEEAWGKGKPTACDFIQR